ncbi:MAG TPA: hypothetical protein VHC43_09150 [Mycobacteriales bacterium]|nr:hypothetical protein [Mycobacteriales bacterium]
MTSEGWAARYPDLAGKVALVAGDHEALVAVVAAFAANGSPVCVVASDRGEVDASIAAAGHSGVMGVVSAPEDPATWARVLPHAEQRLGPIDIVVVLGDAPGRDAVRSAALPDMKARRRGVLVEVADDGGHDDSTGAVRHRRVYVEAATRPQDVAAVVALCASDVLAAAVADIRLRP